jgi:uncharacterized protein (UPF0248 family)
MVTILLKCLPSSSRDLKEGRNLPFCFKKMKGEPLLGIMILSRITLATGFLPRMSRRSVRTLWARQESTLSMENLYKEWTLEEDKTLWRYRSNSTEQLASRLGRGLRGVEKRLSKLHDIESAAYQRLFVKENGAEDEEETESNRKEKLMPAGEILRRIKWDYNLDENEFSILHYDRLEDMVVESPFNAKNEDVSGSETQLIDALPEHRIVGIKYKDRIVWDRKERLDMVFGSPGIANVIKDYDEWWRRQQEERDLNRRRKTEVTIRLRRILGPKNFDELESASLDLVSASKGSTMIAKREVEEYVQKAQDLFRRVRNDPSTSIDSTMIPMSDYEALDIFSELVAIMPDENIRNEILSEIYTAMKLIEGKKISVAKNRELPQLDEHDLTETFVRGSGPGGQKINKTSNRVVLVHNPTQLRVEVQDTRSLQQNRKIARKRLRERLDEFMNGRASKSSMASAKASTKKSQSKARSKARHRRKRELKQVEQEDN